MIAYKTGDYQLALDYHKKDLAIAQELGDKGGEGGAYGNIGNAYEKLGDYQLALDYKKISPSRKSWGIKAARAGHTATSGLPTTASATTTRIGLQETSRHRARAGG